VFKLVHVQIKIDHTLYTDGYKITNKLYSTSAHDVMIENNQYEQRLERSKELVLNMDKPWNTLDVDDNGYSFCAYSAVKPAVQLLQIQEVHREAHSSACNFCRFYLFFLPVVSRPSFTSRILNKDHKTEELFYFFLVQVL
jgi:D-alanyl-lipoteichoic acid acyltransferase DltB (MBOAT superfamily)